MILVKKTDAFGDGLDVKQRDPGLGNQPKPGSLLTKY